MRPELEGQCWCRVGLCTWEYNDWARLCPLLSLSWPPCFPTRSCGRQRAAGVAQLELSVCISDILRGSNQQGRSFQQQVWLHCSLLRAFYAPWIYSSRKSSLSVWAEDHFVRVQKGTVLFLAVCVEKQMESEHVWLSHTGSRGNPGSGPGSQRAAFAHRAQLSRWVQILPCLVASELHELAEATVLTK